MNDPIESHGQTTRPYDHRWGTPEQVHSHFGIAVATLKAMWKRGWVRARQPQWESDSKRSQIVYCFEDIAVYTERFMHSPSQQYVEKFWTDSMIATAEEKLPDGPYAHARAPKRYPTHAAIRKDGFARLERRDARHPASHSCAFPSDTPDADVAVEA